MMDAPEPLNAPKNRRRRWIVTPEIEFAVLAVAVAIAVASYFVISSGESAQRLLTPPLVALLLVANLVPAIALLVLIGRRIAMSRAARSQVGGGGRLHVRLVALFSVLASVPMLLVTVFASLLFQYGVEFWFSDKARGMLENAQVLARESYRQMLDQVDDQVVTMANDLGEALKQRPIESIDFQGFFATQVYVRSLSEGVIFTVTPDNVVQSEVLVDPYERDLEKAIDIRVIDRLRKGQPSVVSTSAERTQSITRIPGTEYYLYAARVSGAERMAAQNARAEAVLADYNALLTRSRSLQLRFNAALLLISLLIVGIAVFVALTMADRLVRPLGELVDAARRVTGGDLTARVSPPGTHDEVATLGIAFNRMTARLQEQTNALVAANDESESRRALIAAVMEGVTAGVIATDPERRVLLINSSAVAMLKPRVERTLGKPLAQVCAELDQLLDSETHEATIQLSAVGEARTLAVKITQDESGHILTFDDITQQLLDQRRAAWADVARRIAHEIKNPLTPIQLAAERLQRRYGKNVEEGDTVFARLTETIVRQVGDLRRMVDEFSSFARMPKPVFREESIVDIARQTLFLHEVAHADIQFALEQDEVPMLVCDRRQISQALTNLVKNAVESIGAREAPETPGQVTIRIGQEPGRLTLDVLDNGIGLPVERDRIVEPYMTTRARGTGLGLAIVKKIAEEHFGTITFADREGGGAIVSLCFDTELLSRLATAGGEDSEPADDRPVKLTRGVKT